MHNYLDGEQQYVYKHNPLKKLIKKDADEEEESQIITESENMNFDDGVPGQPL